MDMDAAMDTDRYYRLMELSRDPVVGARVTALLESEIALNKLKSLILTVDKAAGIKACKDYLKEVYG